MSFSYEDRESDSPFVQTIWRTQGEQDGCYTSAADGSWDFLIIKEDGQTQFNITGAATKAVPVVYKAGVEYLGIRFKVGAYLPQFPVSAIVDNMLTLPQATSASFWFHDSMLPLPHFDNVESFLDRLARNRLLAQDAVVDAVLQGDTQALSLRSVQRHFARTTGLTHKYVRQIERARQAVALLERGVPVIDAAFAAGYTDQPHMTKALKHLIGQTPRQIRLNRPA